MPAISGSHRALALACRSWGIFSSVLLLSALLLSALAVPVSPAHAQAVRHVTQRLTAIDILLLPDQTMVGHAQADNARLRRNYPAGFALDITHQPHISLLQRYVLTEDLDKVYAAVDTVFRREDPAGWELEAVRYFYVEFGGLPLAGIVVRPTPELLRLQQEIVDAVAPYTRPSGTAAAFVTSPQAPGINLSTIDYVDTFVPKQTGKNYSPHVTIGVSHEDFVQKMLAAPFPRFKFKVAGAAVFHLGNFGTAARPLWRWEGEVAAADVSQQSFVDPLPSWNEGSTKTAIEKFVRGVTTEGGPNYVPAHERIATFDNDGTLWCEMPIYTQCAFAIDRVKKLAPAHPDWKNRQPFRAVLENDTEAVIASGELGLVEIVMATHAGVTPEKFQSIVRDWLATARHPRFKRPYTSLAYQPMLELLAYLRANDFKTFIVSGGGIEFMRPWTARVYGIPPYQVVGSTVLTEYSVHDGQPVLMRLPKVDFIDDFAGKPIGINKFIGLRPIAAFGNSDGDYEMLRWTTAGDGPRFGLIVHHTDAVREYAYDYPSLVGQLKRALDEAPERGWTIVSMKSDWKTIFPAPTAIEQAAER